MSFLLFIINSFLFFFLFKCGESLFLRKLVLGIPAQASGKNLTRPLMPSAPRFVLVTSSRPNKGSEHWLQMTWRRVGWPFILSPPSLSLRLRQNNRPYGYRGLKIFTSLKLRFQDFQRMKYGLHSYF